MAANIEQIKSKARKFEQKNKWDKALKEYQKILEISGNERDYRTLMRMGDIYLKKNEPNNAIDKYKEAIAIYEEEELYTNAIALCKKILRVNKNVDDIRFKLAELLAKRRLANEAMRTYLEYAESRQKKGDLEGVLIAHLRIVELDPHNMDIRKNIAEMCLQLNREEEAIKHFVVVMKHYKEREEQDKLEEIENKLIQINPDWMQDYLSSLDEASNTTEIESSELNNINLPSNNNDGFNLPTLDFEIPELDDEEETSTETTTEETLVLTDISNIDLSNLAGLEEEELKLPIGTTEEDIIISDGINLDIDTSNLPSDTETKPASVEETTVNTIKTSTIPEVITDPLLQLSQHLQKNPTDWVSFDKLGDLLRGRGNIKQAPESFQRAIAGYTRDNNLIRVFEIYEKLISMNPYELSLHSKKVKVAIKLNENDLIVRSYSDLAEVLTRINQIDRAVIIYRKIIEINPTNGLAKEQLAKYAPVEEETSIEIQSVKTIEKTTPPIETSPTEEEGDFMDLADLLNDDDDENNEKTQMVLEGTSDGAPPIMGLDEIIDSFKSGISESVEVEDYDSHYDLGVAYKEMGLLEEAISEFQIATRGQDTRLKAYEMLGVSFMEKGNLEFAVKQFERGLKTPKHSDEEYLGCHYHLGLAYEQLGEYKKAIEQLEEVYLINVSFKDVRERLESLQNIISGKSKKRQSTTTFSIDDDEADALFDF